MEEMPISAVFIKSVSFEYFLSETFSSEEKMFSGFLEDHSTS